MQPADQRPHRAMPQNLRTARIGRDQTANRRGAFAAQSQRKAATIFGSHFVQILQDNACAANNAAIGGNLTDAI